MFGNISWREMFSQWRVFACTYAGMGVGGIAGYCLENWFKLTNSAALSTCRGLASLGLVGLIVAAIWHWCALPQKTDWYLMIYHGILILLIPTLALIVAETSIL